MTDERERDLGFTAVSLILFFLVLALVAAIAMGQGWRADAERFCDMLGGVYDGAECLVVNPR